MSIRRVEVRVTARVSSHLACLAACVHIAPAPDGKAGS